MAGSWSQYVQLGRESTKGTAVAATTIWRGVGSFLKDEREIEFVPEQVGLALPVLRTYTPKHLATIALAATPATFEELPHILDAGLKTATATQDGAGSDYIYAYAMSSTAVGTIKTYTIETGDADGNEESAYCFVTDFTLSGERGAAVMVSSNWVGRTVGPTAKTGGLSLPSVAEILAAQGVLYIDDAGGTIGTTAVSSTLLDWSLKVTTGRKPRFTVDSGQLYFDRDIFDKAAIEWILDVTFEHNATSVAEKVDWRAEASRLFRLELTGPAVASAGTVYSNKTLIVDVAGRYQSFDALEDDDGNTVVKASLRGGYDETSTEALTITVVNELTAMP